VKTWFCYAEGMKKKAQAVLVCGVMATAGVALAQDGGAKDDGMNGGVGAGVAGEAVGGKIHMYSVEVEPTLWYAAMSGKVSLPGGPAGDPTVSLDDLNADSPRATPFGQVRVNVGSWLIDVSAFSTSADRSTTAQTGGQLGTFTFIAGDPLRVSVDMTSAQVMGGYRFGPWPSGKQDDGSFSWVPSVVVLGGARLYDIGIGIGATSPTTAKAEEFFIEPVLGARLEMDLTQAFSVNVETTVGWMPSGHESLSWDISAGFVWRPVEHLGVQLGYRNLWFDLDSGEGTRWDGGVAGLFAGVQLRF